MKASIKTLIGILIQQDHNFEYRINNCGDYDITINADDRKLFEMNISSETGMSEVNIYDHFEQFDTNYEFDLIEELIFALETGMFV